jgi:hypothetical protein
MENECRGDGKDGNGRNEADPWGKKDCNQQSRLEFALKNLG